MSLLGIGGYTAESGGRATGITLADLDEHTGRLTMVDALALPSPSWLTWHPSRPVLYAANEIDDGAVSAVAVQGSRLRLLASTPTGGSQPCHLAISPDGRRLYAANYESGSLAAFALAADGTIEARTDLATHVGHGQDRDRQAGPHVHMAVLAELSGPDGELISAVDLGTDQIISYRLDNGLLSEVAVSSLPAGCGPRQLARAAIAGKAYLVAELSAQLLTLDEFGPGSFTVVGATPASEQRASGQPTRNLPAQLSLSADGRLGYLSNRGPDTIAVFDLTGPAPLRLAEHPVGPGWPRHFALAGDWLLSANQHGHELTVFAVTGGGAELRETGRYRIGSPTCMALRTDPNQ